MAFGLAGHPADGQIQHVRDVLPLELLEPVDPDAVGYQDRNSFWSNVIGGRDTLSRLPGVEPPKVGGRTWRYRRENG